MIEKLHCLNIKYKQVGVKRSTETVNDLDNLDKGSVNDIKMEQT